MAQDDKEEPTQDTLKDRASKGGKARAARLTKEEKRSIALAGAEARWGMSVPVVQYGSSDRPLRIGELEIPCYVLDDGRRVIVQRGLLRAMNIKRGGSADGVNDRLSRFVGTKGLSTFITPELAEMIAKPILFRIGHLTAYGYEATVLADLCDVVLAARKAGALNYQQQHIAEQCEILVRAFSRVGIIALVDEVTGFQAVRDQNALAKFLEAYIQKELRKWVRTFPREFFYQLCRLKGMDLPADMRLPSNFGKIINDLVYDRLGPGIRAELNRRNPVTETGRRRHKHFQYLTENIGHPQLLHHLGKLIGLAHAFEDGEYDKFYAAVNRALPVQDTLPLFAQAEAAAKALAGG